MDDIKVCIKGCKDQISRNFNSSEFDCHCESEECNVTKIDEYLIVILQHLRQHFQRPIQINSGYRCDEHNAVIGGVVGSQHTLGKAVDIVVAGVDIKCQQEYISNLSKELKFSVGLYNTFTHIDVRDVPVHFDRRTR